MADTVVTLHDFCKFGEVTPPFASRHFSLSDKEKWAACSYKFFSTMELHGPSAYSAAGHNQWTKQLQVLPVYTFYTPSMTEEMSNYDNTPSPASEP